MTALTGTPWLAVLQRIIRFSNDDTTRVLAMIVHDMLSESSDPQIGVIADYYARQLLGSLT